MTRAIVISQLPPPIHGSTMMTQVFLETLNDINVEWRLVERRFSASVDEVGKFSLKKLSSAFWMPMRLLAAVIRFHPHVTIFFATNRTFSFLVDWALSEILRATCRRRVLYIHTTGFRSLASKGRLWAWLVKRLIGSATKLICLGPSLAKDVAPWIDESRISFIPNTVPGEPVEGTLPVATEPVDTVLYLSNLIPEKGASDFVDMALALCPSFLTTQFIIAGASSSPQFTESLHKRVAESPHAQQIHFIGLVGDQSEKWRLIREASILVFPSTYPFEAQPLTILEAFSVGTPVVAYDVGGIKDILSDSENGSLLPRGNRTALSETVRGYLLDPEKRRSLSAVAKQIYDSRFGRESYIRAWSRVLKEL